MRLTPPRLSLQADNISAIVKAAGVEVEPYWPTLFAKLLEKRSIVSGRGAAAAGGLAQAQRDVGSRTGGGDSQEGCRHWGARLPGEHHPARKGSKRAVAGMVQC